MTVIKNGTNGILKLANWIKLVFITEPLAFIVFISTKFLNVVITAAFLYYSGMLIDSVVAQMQGDSAQSPGSVILVMITLGIIGGASNYIGSMAIQKATDQMDHSLSKRFLCTIRKSDYLLSIQEEYKNKNHVAGYILDNAAFWMVIRFTMFFTAVVYIFVYSALIESNVLWITILAGILMLVPKTIIQMRLVKEKNDLNMTLSGKQRLNDMYRNLITSAYSAKEIRMFKLFDTLFNKWESGFVPVQNEYKKMENRHQHVDVFFKILSQLLIFMLFLYTFRAAPFSTPGQFTVILGAFTTIMFQFLHLGTGIGDFYRSIKDIERLEEFEDFAASVPMQPAPMQKVVSCKNEHAVELRNVCFGYTVEKDVLKNINFTIEKGETLAIVGSNGCGKTTLAKLLVGLFSPRVGDVLINGKSPEILAPGCEIAIVAQNFGQYNALTLRENISFGQMDAKIAQIISIIDTQSRLENNLDTLIGNDFEGIGLSGGEWQRIALLRPLFTNADIIIFDEPTASLDPISEVKTFQEFMSLYKNKTRIIISHRLGAIKGADKIIVMDAGQIVGIGRHQELLATNTLYRTMYESQASWYKEGYTNIA